MQTKTTNAINLAIERLADSKHNQVILWFADPVDHMNRMDVLVSLFEWENYDGDDDANITSAVITVPNDEEDDSSWDYLVGYDPQRGVAMLATMDENGEFDNKRLSNEDFRSEKSSYYQEWWQRNSPAPETTHVTPQTPPDYPPAYASEEEF